MRTHRLLSGVLLIAVASLALVACRGGDVQAPTATATPTASAAVTSAAAAPAGSPTAAPTQAPGPLGAGPRDAMYLVEGKPVQLAGGIAEVAAAPGSASTVTTRYFGNEATCDLNRDGLDDVAFVLTQSGGGSGTFFYAVAAVRTSAGYTGTNAVLLGDRVAPQSTSCEGGRVTFNFAERRAGEPMTERPSVGVSRTYVVEDGRLVERR